MVPFELDPEAGAALSVRHPASETVRTGSNVDAMRLKFIWFHRELRTSAQHPPARCAALVT
ncbi:MAG: hypothetical protein CBARDCOR_6538 [uncultured Caballeronia sp.]|nr:MAG: hypothetical protein CBARDCOR_6538 [uncultured Caballeronia sp.]